jgi:hypothetical protein
MNRDIMPDLFEPYAGPQVDDGFEQECSKPSDLKAFIPERRQKTCDTIRRDADPCRWIASATKPEGR